LAGAYNLNANWKHVAAAPVQYTSNGRLTGTFKLDSVSSDNPRESADRAVRNLSRNDRQNISQRLLSRLESPDMLAIQRRSLSIPIASSLAPQSTFEADGIDHQEQASSGRSNRVTATLRDDQLVVSSTGYKENDFKVTFESIENGRRLRVKREIYSERLSQPVVVNSIYDRVSETAQWNVYGGTQPYLKTSSDPNREFILRDGENVIGILDTDLSTKQTKQGDAFTITLGEPSQYAGAVIAGTVGNVEQSGRLTGRSGLSLNFDSIKLRNGETYRFAGTLTNVRLANNELVKVDNEGSAQGDSQTTQTVTRTGIGTVIGVIIGAIAGGGKGAAIGGIIGATGGAGSVYVQGKDELTLPRGTELTIRAAATN
jgi:hypothetical protein